MDGVVVEVRRFSVHDGPGIRSTVFLKGCNLRCRWCHNPETLRLDPELQVLPEKCIGCGDCVKACPNGVHELAATGKVFHRDRCTACGACAAGCYSGALTLVGKRTSAQQVVEEVLADRAFYLSSGGGLTISGGEPLFQRPFTLEILQRCGQAGIARAIETNLAWPWEHYEELLGKLELVMADIKLMDSAAHKHWTGLGNERILDNAARLKRGKLPLIVRTPVVPGVNDTAEEVGRIAAFLAGAPNLLYYELLPYHPMAAGKYESLGMEYHTQPLPRPSRQQMLDLAGCARSFGIPVRTPDE